MSSQIFSSVPGGASRRRTTMSVSADLDRKCREQLPGGASRRRTTMSVSADLDRKCREHYGLTEKEAVQ